MDLEMYAITSDSLDDSLEHHGVKGMKWGVRRYQNKDGSLTPEGSERLNKWKEKEIRQAHRRVDHFTKSFERKANRQTREYYKAKERGNQKVMDKMNDKISRTNRNVARGKRIVETEVNKLKNMTYDEMLSDKRATAVDYGTEVAGYLLAGPVGGAVILSITGDYYHNKTKRRTGESLTRGWN